jgi:hypothetical protein
LAQCDFLSFSEDAARALRRGEPMPEEARRTRDFLHLGFGGTPVLLPESRVLLSNAVFRAGYLVFSRFCQGQAFLRRM